VRDWLGLPADPGFCAPAPRALASKRVVTLGARGCAMLVGGATSGGRCSRRRGDTVGAGDAFAAAFCTGSSRAGPRRKWPFLNRAGTMAAACLAQSQADEESGAAHRKSISCPAARSDLERLSTGCSPARWRRPRCRSSINRQRRCRLRLSITRRWILLGIGMTSRLAERVDVMADDRQSHLHHSRNSLTGTAEVTTLLTRACS
jgi:hypothetical protein